LGRGGGAEGAVEFVTVERETWKGMMNGAHHRGVERWVTRAIMMHGEHGVVDCGCVEAQAVMQDGQ
jgi:hypothetical protein